MLILDALLEFLLQLLFELIWEVILHGAKKGVKATGRRTSFPRALRALKFVTLGALNGWLSVYAFPNRLFSGVPPTGLSLLLAPLLTGLGMWCVGRIWPSRAEKQDSLFHFWTAFDFAFGMALMRFLHATGWLL